MCMEDLKLGKKRNSIIFGILVPITSIEVAPANSKRVSITFYPAKTKSVAVGIVNPATLTNGVYLANLSVPLTLTREQHGDIVTRAFYGIADTAQDTISVITSEFSGDF